MKWLSSLFLVAAVSVAGFELQAELAQPQVILHEPRLAALYLLGTGLVLLLIWTLMEEAGWGFMLVNLGMLGELGLLLSGYRMVRGEVVLEAGDRFILAAAGMLVFSLLNLFLAYLDLRGEAGARPARVPAGELARPSPSQLDLPPVEQVEEVGQVEAGMAPGPSPGSGEAAQAAQEEPEEKGEVSPIQRGLSVIAGEQAGSFFPLQGDGPWKLGRGEEVEIRLSDPKVSRLHAELSLTPLGLEIRDLGSTNGTFVNGTRITEPQMLRDGDLIEVGDSSLRVVYPADEK